jgi:hypothetical protein
MSHNPTNINCTDEYILKPLLRLILNMTDVISCNKKLINGINYSLFAFFSIILILIIILMTCLVLKCVKNCKKNKQQFKKINIVDIDDLDQSRKKLINKTQTDCKESEEKRRLENMEFYRRLIINQMMKREKLEENYVEKVGNLFRNGVNTLFGDPRRGLDFTDPQVMFHPYWPERKDYSLLNAYGAIQKYILEDKHKNIN